MARKIAGQASSRETMLKTHLMRSTLSKNTKNQLSNDPYWNLVYYACNKTVFPSI